MSRKSKDEAEKTRERILESALTLFSRDGYERTTFTDIASRLEMTKGAVYWHFSSKEDLLLALVDEMLKKFRALIEFDEKLTFGVVCELMVSKSKQMLGNPQDVAFFLLMSEQIRWSSSSMEEVRRGIFKAEHWGPWQAFRLAVANEKRAGRVRADVDSDEIATLCMILWQGLTYGEVVKLSPCDMERAMRRAFSGVWREIAVEPLKTAI